MSQHNKKYSINFSIIRAFLAMVVVILAGCTDDFIDGPIDIPDAEVELKGEVIFKPLVPMAVQTRAEAPDGGKYKGIKSLYVFFFDSEGKPVTEYSGNVDFTPVPSEGSTHEHITFKKKVRAGRYYVYAIANISDTQKSDLTSVTSIEDLRNFKLVWNDNIENDLEMFGVFQQDYDKGTGSAPGNENFEEDVLLTITPDRNSLHSWVRRAVSKVTVDFDGTNLKEGVTVYIKNAVLKDVASGVLLGASSAVGENDFTCITSDYSITYGEGEDHNAWPTVTKASKFSPSEIWGTSDVTSFHDDNAKALPCYENMQGTHEDKSKLQDSDGDGVIDSETKDGVDNGTYLEVEGYYVANRPEYKSEGEITYRFMLGNNATSNFDLVRNHHYKIKMNFKDYGNDIDWHIEYAEKYLDVTYPEDVNYQGKFFVPDINYQADMANAGHTFNDQNVITVTSYATNGMDKEWIEPEISYTYYSYNEQVGVWDIDNTTSEWLTLAKGTLSDDGSQMPYTFVASMTDPTESTINDLFPTASKGSEDSPYNLSGKDGGSSVENTANCYMVGAPGWYCFPLVYGNAITGGATNSEAYSSSNIVNHLKNNITTPYIKDNAGISLSNVSVKLIWQDAENLIIPNEIQYDPSLFGGKGGIKFHISNIREGNAVIALIDKSAGEDEYVNLDRGSVYGKGGSTKAIWSWHIWATRFGFGDFEKDIRILNHEEKAFDVMPVNLGWCSGGKAIKYYKRRKCDIKFKVGDHEIIRTIEQYPHFVLPRGDHPYYQWGRKDPFVGSNTAFGNKPRWTYDGTKYIKYEQWSDYNPPRLYQEPIDFQNNAGRKHTRECLDVLVKNPDKWHNAPRWPNPENPPYKSINESPTDLWSIHGQKTVYDPCPAGYQVSDNTVFTGFTTHGGSAKFPYDWYDVLESNMPQDYYSTDMSVNRQVLELYTDTRKVQSITFPVTGYRDYDSKAEVMKYPQASGEYEGYVWFNNAQNQTNSYHFKFHRYDIQGTGEDGWKERGGDGLNLIAPYEAFYNTDGFGVRPVSTKRPELP